MSLTSWSYTLLYLLTIDVNIDKGKMIMFYYVNTTNLTIVGNPIEEFSK